MLGFFNKKKTKESNSLFGNQVLANQLLTTRSSDNGQWQLLYTTISDSTAAGQNVDITRCTRNSTIIACMNWKARALAQMTPKVMWMNDESGQFECALQSENISRVDKQQARKVQNLLKRPNNFQSTHEFLAQAAMWLDLTGELFILNWRADQQDVNAVPTEIYVMDTTLMTARVNAMRYPSYRNSGPVYGFNENTEFADHQICHILEGPWQGASGFNKLIQCSELVNLSQAIDEYSNFVLANSAKPSGTFSTDLPIQDSKLKEIAARLKESWNQLVGSRDQDYSKAGQAMVMESGFKYTPIAPPTLQDMDTSKLKDSVDKRLCGLMGVPPGMVGVGMGEKFNNAVTSRDEAYRTTLYPLLHMISAKLNMSFFKSYPNLEVQFDVSEFLKGDALAQAQYSASLVQAGIMTPNEARQYLSLPKLEGSDELQSPAAKNSMINDRNGDTNVKPSGQDTNTKGSGAGGSPTLRAVA